MIDLMTFDETLSSLLPLVGDEVVVEIKTRTRGMTGPTLAYMRGVLHRVPEAAPGQDEFFSALGPGNGFFIERARFEEGWTSTRFDDRGARTEVHVWHRDCSISVS